MEREQRNPYQAGVTSTQGGNARAPGKMSLTEALGSASAQAPELDAATDPKPGAGTGVADKEEVFGDDSTAKPAPAERPLPRLDLGKKAKPHAHVAGPKPAAGPGAAVAAAPEAAAHVAAPHAAAAAPHAAAAPAHADAAKGGGHHGGEGKPADNAGGGAQPGPDRTTPDPKANTKIQIAAQRVAPGNGNQGRTSVGVGEDVTFTHPGDGEWTAGGKSLGPAGDVGHWKAPSTAGDVEVSHAVKGGAAQKQTMKVVAPLGVEFASKGAVPVPPAGVSMTTKVTVLPTTVSFGACEWLEVPGGAESPSGYFDAYIKAGKGDLAHKPNANWTAMGDNNAGVEDHAFAYDKPRIAHPEAGGKVEYWQGAFSWNIPNKFRVAGDGDGQVFTTVRQAFTMADDGAMSVQKGAANASQGSDGKVAGDMIKCATVGEANAILNPLGRRGAVQFVMQYNASPNKDPDTQKNLVAALKGDNIKFYVHVHCDNTYNFFSRDRLDFVVQGAKGSHSENFLINSKKNKEFTFSFEELFDYGTMVGGAVVLRATNDDNNSFIVAMTSPLDSINEVGGTSGGHYQISAHIQD